MSGSPILWQSSSCFRSLVASLSLEAKALKSTFKHGVASRRTQVEAGGLLEESAPTPVKVSTSCYDADFRFTTSIPSCLSLIQYLVDDPNMKGPGWRNKVDLEASPSVGEALCEESDKDVYKGPPRGGWDDGADGNGSGVGVVATAVQVDGDGVVEQLAQVVSHAPQLGAAPRTVHQIELLAEEHLRWRCCFKLLRPTS